ncbi:pimeloyl-ACP methyl ester carboxylesterase [Arthrobacter sp. PL16]|uniref:Alpha/beta hydrolase n=1 Tax=Arthrobacter cheniae TaxID=1258888 RepID=A0A3A5MG09_9MICC|nr:MULTISPECIES: alpha/beta hydrolase [Arthrobacter]MEC5198395.1 pimeloyl-ACP methyl ester carboxylesterase [Arthrobacter sp. PL16]RJT81888.1 alpha/beta hydrolase [Arthrobacter cheniae]
MRDAVVRSMLWEGTLQLVWDFPAVDGPGRADRTTIVMVHGFRGDHHGLLRLVEELPAHRVLLPDLPGFGQGQELPGSHDVGTYARFVRDTARGFAPGPLVVLGHSFGSIVAAEAAALDPDLAGALVLVNPISAPALEGPSRVASRIAETYYVAADRLPEAAGRALLSNPVIVRGMSMFMAKTKDRTLRRWIHGQHDAYFSSFASRRVVLEAFRASISGTVRDRARDLVMPVLLIAAEQDDIGSVASQRELAALIPHATLEVIPDVGHLVHYEKPREAALLIEDFLESVPA